MSPLEALPDLGLVQAHRILLLHDPLDLGARIHRVLTHGGVVVDGRVDERVRELPENLVLVVLAPRKDVAVGD